MQLNNETARHRLRRAQRLDRQGVERVLERGRSVRSSNFRLQFADGPADAARLAMIVSKRNAVRAIDRSRVRRLVREAFRVQQDSWRGTDCVIRLVRPYADGEAYAAELNKLFGRRR